MISQPLKYDSQMLFMLFRTLWIYKYVINENHNERVQLQHEYRIHEYMKSAGAFVNPNDMTRYS
jgi:hypothetical protein